MKSRRRSGRHIRHLLQDAIPLVSGMSAAVAVFCAGVLGSVYGGLLVDPPAAFPAFIDRVWRLTSGFSCGKTCGTLCCHHRKIGA